MALEQLLAALEREASAEAETLLATARTEAAGIAREAALGLEQRRHDALVARERELRARAEVALGAARRAAGAAVLTARWRLIERVLAAARARFPAALAEPAYSARLPEHLAEALAAVGEEPATIHCPETLLGAVRGLVAARANVGVLADPAAPPGVSITTADGAVTVDNTLDTRLERLRPQLALEILGQLGAKR